MQKPNNYDSIQIDYVPIELGSHTAVIKRLKETTSKAGRPMIQIAIDFDKADKQPEYFMNAFNNDDRPDKKWPFQGTHYILTEDQDGKCSRSFKAFISSVENSNNSECVWGDGFEKWFVNKRVGVVYGENEEEYNGEVKTRRRIRYFCSYDKAKDAAVPDKRFLPTTATTTQPVSNNFINVPEGAEDAIPF